MFKIGAHPMRLQARRTDIYACPVCRAKFKEKILLAIYIGKRH